MASSSSSNSQTVTITTGFTQNHLMSMVKSYFSFICHIFSAMAMAFVVVILVRLLLSVALKPHFVTVGIDYATVTSFNTTTTTTEFNFTFVFLNPNHKLTVSYKNLGAKLRFENDDLTLAFTSLPPFSQGTESETKVRAKLTVIDGANEIAAKEASGTVEFGVTVLGRVRFGKGIMRSRVIHLRVECEPVIMAFPPGKTNGTGTLVGHFNCCSV